MQDGTTLHFVVGGGFVIIPANETKQIRIKSLLTALRHIFKSHLFAGKDETLLLRRNSFFLFDPLFDPINLVRGLDIDFDLLAG